MSNVQEAVENHEAKVNVGVDFCGQFFTNLIRLVNIMLPPDNIREEEECKKNVRSTNYFSSYLYYFIFFFFS